MTVAKSHILYQCPDVTALIAQGDNAIGAIVGDGWYASPFGWRIERYGFGPAPRRFRAQIRLDYGDGSREWVATGPDWTIAPSPILTSEIYDGETYDARAERPGWDRPGFDASRSEEHPSELQSLMRISYAVFRLEKKNEHTTSYKNN